MTAVIVRVRALSEAEAAYVKEIVLDDLDGLVEPKDYSVTVAAED